MNERSSSGQSISSLDRRISSNKGGGTFTLTTEASLMVYQKTYRYMN